MIWTTLYSPFLLKGLLPDDKYLNWCYFSKACSLLCRPYLQIHEVEEADKLLIEFCFGVQQLYGWETCTPNMHLHGHLKDCIFDVGPLHSFWCFSFEQFNGILENRKKWKAPERQLIAKFSFLQAITKTSLANGAPPELVQYFFETTTKCQKIAADPLIDGHNIMNYEKNMKSLPKEICALKMNFHFLIPPGREKFMTELDREVLTEMYDRSRNIDYVPLRCTR